MKELSQEQIERALSAVEKISTWPMDLDQAREQLIAAAPYLQFPWEPPTLDEIEHARVVHALNDPFGVAGVLRNFVHSPWVQGSATWQFGCGSSAAEICTKRTKRSVAAPRATKCVVTLLVEPNHEQRR